VSNSFEAGIGHWPGDRPPEEELCSGANCLSAYNQTQGYVLGTGIASGDFTPARLEERMPMLTPQSGAGLWIIPFRGIPVSTDCVLLDLLYLDADCRVIEAVELFPTYRVSPSSPPAASVLVLPTQTIFLSHTQSGDQLVFEIAEQHDPAHLDSSRPIVRPVQTAPEVCREPEVNAVAEQRQEVDIENNAAALQPAEAENVPQPWIKSGKKKNWLQRLLSPDPEEPRKAHRRALPGLSAYFWTGATPEAHAILNISSTGLYVETAERWYPGTLIQMTLKKTEQGSTKIMSTISVLAKANRWGNDGVGLEFVVRNPRNPHPDGSHADGVDREELDRFLKEIGHSSS
jgi:hypothetical protein